MAPLTRLAVLCLLAAARPSAAGEPPRLRALTINVAGIPVVHPRIGERIAGLGRALREGGYDVIGLQEAWLARDARRLARDSGLAYSAFPHGFPIGSGLGILSRWPIVLIEERTFSVVRPSLINITQGETFSPKGMMLARVATPWGELDVYDTHTISEYATTRYQAMRVTELYELSEFVLERSHGRPFIVLGDLNTGPGARDFELFLDALGARDVCREKGRETCGDPSRKGPRIDHILIPPGSFSVRARRVLDESVPDARPPVAYSDHFGFAADLPAPALLRLRPRPNPERRAAALHEMDATFARMIGRLEEVLRARGWIPVYGTIAASRYARQIRVLNSLRERVQSSRAR